MGPEKHDFWAILSKGKNAKKNFVFKFDEKLLTRVILCVVFESTIGFAISPMGPVLRALGPVPGGPRFHYIFLSTNWTTGSP